MEDIKLVIRDDWLGLCRRRAKGRPQRRWRDAVINDLKKQKLRNWSDFVKDRKAWSDMAQNTKPVWGCIDRRRRKGEEGEGGEEEKRRKRRRRIRRRRSRKRTRRRRRSRRRRRRRRKAEEREGEEKGGEAEEEEGGGGGGGGGEGQGEEGG